MFGLLLLAFIVVPLVEIYVIIQVGSAIGGFQTILLLVLDSIIGAWLVRREGFSILAKVQAAIGRGEVPTNSIIDGLLVLVAGALMLTPGFVTDGVGLLLLLPPTRAIVRTFLKKRYAGKVTVGGASGSAGFGIPKNWGPGGGATDVRSTDVTDQGPDEEPPAIELGPIDS